MHGLKLIAGGEMVDDVAGGAGMVDERTLIHFDVKQLDNWRRPMVAIQARMKPGVRHAHASCDKML